MVVWSVVGALLLAAVLRDVFHTLWHPAGHGQLSRAAMSVVWRGMRLRGGRWLGMAGPLAMVATVLLWAVIAILGWALVYWPHMSDSFAFSPGLDPQQRSSFVDALYLSLVTVATLGYGDIVPTAAWLRLASPLQALMGFALLSAAVTWVLQLYSALGRRRTLARRLTLLHDVSAADALEEMSPSAAAALLHSVAAELAQVTVDLSQYTESYFFHDSKAASLPATLPHVRVLADAGERASSRDVQVAGATLRRALAGLTHLLDVEFLHVGGGEGDVVAVYARDHRQAGELARRADRPEPG